MSEERFGGICDPCGDPCDDACDSKPDGKKCNLCKCLRKHDDVVLGTKGGFVICGTVSDIECSASILQLEKGAKIFKADCCDDCVCACERCLLICCDDIEWLF